VPRAPQRRAAAVQPTRATLLPAPYPAARHAPQLRYRRAQAGIHLKIVSVRLGHTSETFTAQVYQHALPSMDREAAGTIAALFLGDQAITGVSKSVSNHDKNGHSDDL
jgi:integrase